MVDVDIPIRVIITCNTYIRPEWYEEGTTEDEMFKILYNDLKDIEVVQDMLYDSIDYEVQLQKVT